MKVLIALLFLEDKCMLSLRPLFYFSRSESVI